MRTLFQTALCAALLTCLSGLAWGADIRAVYQDLTRQKDQSETLKQETATSIEQQRTTLQQQLQRLQKRTARVQGDVKTKQEALAKLTSEKTNLSEKSKQDREAMNNLVASVRINARQLQELLKGSHFSALNPDRTQVLAPALNAKHFPGLDDMQLMADLYFSELELSGQVSYPTLTFRNHGGLEEEGSVLLVGPFLAGLENGDTVEILQYDKVRQALSAVPNDLPWSLKRGLDKYLKGNSDRVPMDLSAGAALEQLTHQKSFVDRVKGGGVLVWPIIVLAVAALLIGLERAIFLKRVHDNTDRTMTEVHRRAEKGDWSGCQKLMEGRQTPVYNVIKAGLQARHENREVLESIFQEAILKELPRLERALPLLNIMAAVAPLLGLLGTVTGMIGTFEVINIYGTGDPRLMSGGISVALVTTMLGLMVAIPIMLLHTFLNRRVEHIVGDMEEKSVTLNNIIHRCRRCNTDHGTAA